MERTLVAPVGAMAAPGWTVGMTMAPTTFRVPAFGPAPVGAAGPTAT